MTQTEVFRQLLTSKGVEFILDAQEEGLIQTTSCTTEDMAMFMVLLKPLVCLLSVIDQKMAMGLAVFK
jgi:hypothetical protein